jgi:phosphoserine phosphatase
LILPPETVLIFDLDGTVLTGNSFRYWVRRMLLGRFPGLPFFTRLLLRCRVLCAVILRKFLGGGHFRFKRRLQQLWTQATQRDESRGALRGLCDTLHAQVRPEMKPLLEQVAAAQVNAVLATAAAAEYALPFGMELGFRHILATPPCTQEAAFENSREHKRDAVEAFLRAQGWADYTRVFFTDHEEDLPLIARCRTAIWFGDAGEIPAIREHAPGVSVLDWRSSEAQAIMRQATA